MKEASEGVMEAKEKSIYFILHSLPVPLVTCIIFLFPSSKIIWPTDYFFSFCW